MSTQVQRLCAGATALQTGDISRLTVAGMAYTPRDETPGHHHVVTRGNNKRDIFLSDADRWFFCRTVDSVAKKHGWTVLAYALMKNHYHLVIEIGEAGLSRGMCELNTAYAVHFNKRHDRINHLFGKRYWSRLIEDEASLTTTIRYVVQNPRRAGGSWPLERYTWTSYAATIGLAYARIALARDHVLRLFGRAPSWAVDEFRAFCSAGLPEPEDRRQPP